MPTGFVGIVSNFRPSFRRVALEVDYERVG